MPIDNLKYRLRVKDKYKCWFPLEDPTPYWEDVNKALNLFYMCADEKTPVEVLDYLIYALNKAIEFQTSVHTPADRNPIFYVYSDFKQLRFLCEDIIYYEADFCIKKEKKSPWYNLENQKKILQILVNIKENNYTPLDEFTKKHIQKEFYNYVRSYDSSLENYHQLFG